MKYINKIRIIFLFSFLCLNSLSAFAEEVCRACPFDCRGIGASDKDCKNLRASRGECCVDLDGRGQDQLGRKDENNAGNSYNSRPANPNSYNNRNGNNAGDCPAGFHENERKCNDDERKRGCKDMHSPSGRTCVGW